jgi:hypothetical protein
MNTCWRLQAFGVQTAPLPRNRCCNKDDSQDAKGQGVQARGRSDPFRAAFNKDGQANYLLHVALMPMNEGRVLYQHIPLENP